MLEFVKHVLASQYDAALAMLEDCIRQCPPEHWDGPIARYPFWQVAYHTLCFADLYLSPGKAAFELRPIHPQGWREFDDEYPSRRFTQPELLDYAALCRRKAREAIAAETAASLQADTDLRPRPMSRGELHVYSLRHVQHHAAQLGAYLRRVEPTFQSLEALRWVSTGAR